MFNRRGWSQFGRRQQVDRRMIRTLDGRVRSVLSYRYRRLDNFDLAENVLPIIACPPSIWF